ncbi:chorismate-binding protein [Amphibiibacter pelophylacis]|uniref:Bifunctional anthranilate synthase component I family protein/class IV aminotransferase n=1 Tax=Amphibiibacter pelophylacis TaxID=1799477 RepID=A0ACC6P366_9BURK
MTEPAPFALLDDASSGLGDVALARSRWYSGWRHAHVSLGPQDLAACCERLQADLAAGRHAIVLADFEWGMALQGVAVPPAWLADSPRAPALVFHVFDHLQRLNPAQVQQRLQQITPADEPADVVGWTTDQDETAYRQAVLDIHEAIRAGETYQVNHTRRLHGRLAGGPVALFARLRRAQPVPYGALLALPDVTAPDGKRDAPTELCWVLSHSPELLVAQQGGQLRAQPMKGTAPADSDPAVLAADPKNRAENLMIVDLLRNDLGRVAQTGSVAVSDLFAVQRHATLLQMTSTITATLQPQATLADLLRAVFPCGSITGAPRRQTLRWIARLEHAPRGLYTGAIGWVDAPGRAKDCACPDLMLNVAIRTLSLSRGAQHSPARPDVRATLGVGGGIVLDSDPASEWAESALKARFVQGADPGYTLFETLLVKQDAAGVWQVQHLPQHLDRLRASAHALGFEAAPLDDAAALDALWRQAVAQAESQAVGAAGLQSLRLRLDLPRSGALRAVAQPLAPLPEPARLIWSPTPLFSPDQPLVQAALTAHKTSWRQLWDAALQQAMAAGAFDALLWGQDHPGEAPFGVDGARSTVYARVDGVWITPPAADGALPGTVRARVLAGQDEAALHLGLVAVREQRLSLHAARRADAWAVSNALRGVLPVLGPATWPI